MKKLTVRTNKAQEVIDITDQVQELLSSAEGGGVRVAQLNLLHTTAALSTADLDPGTDQDILDALRAMVPPNSRMNYRHPHDPEHAPDHILSTIIGTDLTLQVKENSLVLGTWQRVILIELDGPREREISACFLNSALLRYISCG